MSHSHPHRGSASDTDLRPDVGHDSTATRRHISPNPNFYRPSPESFSSSYPSSSSSRGPAWAQAGALSILNSCGLEPSDLALLAELPEDVLTVESLPHVLKQIKGKRGAAGSLAPRASSAPLSFSSSSYHRAPGRSSRVWGHRRSQTLQYPLDHVAPEQDCWGDSRTSSAVRSEPTAPSAALSALSSSRYTVDFHHRPGPSEYGKTGRSSFSSAGQERRSCPVGFSEPRSALPSDVHHSKPRVNHREDQASSTRSSSQQAAATSIPLEKEALDFHGTCPTVFPYSCSLCDITVLSEKVWIQHINNSQHAEGQLSLLQQFPTWDCRVESVSRARNQEKRKDEENQADAQNEKSKTETKSDKKPSEEGKVVCVKFPPQSVDETYLRKLTEPFGKIVKILVFPSLAFLELSSTEQAKELVKFHVNYPPTVNGQQMEFSISNTFSFLQGSQVVSFTPVPPGQDGQSDLISIVKRFGPPQYYLFLPSMAYVQMEHTADAQKLVDYYSSNTLRINKACVKVSFSGEYKTLVRVPLAKKYEEQKASTKRTRSSSQDKEHKTKMRQSSKDREQEQRKSNTERSRPREGSRKETRSRSTDKWTRSPSKSKEKPNREVRTQSREKSSRGTRLRSRERSDTKRKTRSRSRDKSNKSSSRGSRTRSRSREKRNKDSKTRSSSTEKSRSNEKSVEEEKTESRAKEEPAPGVEVADTQTEEKAALSTEDGDIEGMEVIGEDGENVEGKEAAESPEEDKPMETTAGNVCEKKKPEAQCESITAAALEDDEEESNFPVGLENCVTVDELEDDQGEDIRDAAEALSSRVVHFRDLPTSSFSDAEFIRLVRGYGKAVRYLVLRRSHEGFIEMCSSAEAQRAAQELTHKPVTFNGCRIFAKTSHKYQRLCNGWEIHLDSDHEEQRSQAPGAEETYSKSDGAEEAAQEVSDRPSMTEKEEESVSEKTQDQISEKDSDPNRSMEETPDNTGASPTPQADQKPEDADQLQDSGSVRTARGPGGAAEPETPTRPVGTEFVRPVVGYFCNLCQLIYADEDEAKQQHCSSLAHYRKYQEKTGKDLWSS